MGQGTESQDAGGQALAVDSMCVSRPVSHRSGSWIPVEGGKE